MDGSKPVGSAFNEVYESDHWDGGSGVGSRDELNAEYRAVLQAVVESDDVKSVVDAGCGDWQFSRSVDWSNVSYRGFDVVQAVVDANRKQFTRPGVQFDQLDFSTEQLPNADLLLCKDVLQHWPLDAVRRFLQTNLSRFKYALITNDVASVHCTPDRLNADIQFAEWRTLDLEKPPFGLRSRASVDLDYMGEWTKRATLFCSSGRALIARRRPGSALNAFRRACSENRLG
jgi:hypothetical protein